MSSPGKNVASKGEWTGFGKGNLTCEEQLELEKTLKKANNKESIKSSKAYRNLI